MREFRTKLAFVDEALAFRFVGKAVPGDAEIIALMIQGIAERLQVSGVIVNLVDLVWTPRQQDMDRLIRVLPDQSQHVGRVVEICHPRNLGFMQDYVGRALAEKNFPLTLLKNEKEGREWLRGLPPL